MDFFQVFEPEEVEMLTDATLHGEVRSHMNRLLIYYPDDCPKASDVMLFFLSCLADAKLIGGLVLGGAIGTLKRKIYLDARRFPVLRKLVIYHYPPDQITHLFFKAFRGINLSGWPEIYREEQRKHDQATYARRLFEQKRCSKIERLGSKPGTGCSRKGRVVGPTYAAESARSQQQKMEKVSVVSLTDVAILPSQGEETIVGTLESHATRFIYTSPRIKTDFRNDNIENSFFRLGDNRMPPLLHFNLREPIMVANKCVRDIQFRLVHCPLGQSDQESDEIDKRLKCFVNEVDAQWMSLIAPPSWFQKINEEYEFYGVLPSMKTAGFALTLFSLIVLVETPFVVVPLRDIEIVHLALPRPGVIDMTVIFQDSHNVFEINSIPLNSLSGIKHRLNWGNVKYYVNAKKTDRMTLVEHMARIPSNFMENELEDSLTFAYYKETDFDQERAALNHRGKKRARSQIAKKWW